jgi:hypothetical protein
VGWQRVCRAPELGGLNIHNLEVMRWALNMRWLWLRKTQPTRPWAGLEIQVHPRAAVLIAVSIRTVVGDGVSTLFWTDRWIQGKSVVELAPELVAAVPARFHKHRTVQEALSSGIWTNDVRNDLLDIAFLQFTCIWTAVQEIQLVPGWLISISGHLPLQAPTSRSQRMSVFSLEQ